MLGWIIYIYIYIYFSYIWEVFIAQVNNNKSIMIMTFVYKNFSSEKIKFLCIHIFIKVFLPEKFKCVLSPFYWEKTSMRRFRRWKTYVYIKVYWGCDHKLHCKVFFMWHSKETFLYSVCTWQYFNSRGAMEFVNNKSGIYRLCYFFILHLIDWYIKWCNYRSIK